VNEPTQVLDKGFVRLESVMGSDLTVVNAARISFNKRSESLTEADKRLIQYLAKHKHWTPFAHPQVTLHIKLPIFVARQWMKSNVGVVYNEVSRRYVDSEPEFYIPMEWRGRPEKGIKQGSGDVLTGSSDLTCDSAYGFAIDASRGVYEAMLKAGCAPEMARMVLPLSTYTEIWMTASLAAIHRICSLRLDPHAQWEIQQYAKAVDSIMAPLFPVSWGALTSITAEGDPIASV
jgi:thymidylate synthase (FAD)